MRSVRLPTDCRRHTPMPVMQLMITSKAANAAPRRVPIFIFFIDLSLFSELDACGCRVVILLMVMPCSWRGCTVENVGLVFGMYSTITPVIATYFRKNG